MSQNLRASAPCRIDFAGGTLDLWPLSAFLGGVQTVNHAITLRTQVEFRAINGPRSVVVSKDLGLRLEVEAQPPAFDEGPLKLVALALRAVPPPQAYELTLHSPVPKGSGLGASSTLLITILNGLVTLRGEAWSKEQYVALARDIEAQLIGVPTGTQDYWAALRGGLSVLDFPMGFPVGRANDAALGPKLKDWLGQHLLVLFSGEAHFSAAPNWSMMKAYIENQRDGAVRAAFQEVLAATRDAVVAITEDSPEALVAAIQREWQARVKLSDAVCPARLKAIMDLLLKQGALALKLCGAGGGGSMICLVPPERQQEFKSTAEAHGLSVLPAGLDDQGVAVEELS